MEIPFGGRRSLKINHKLLTARHSALYARFFRAYYVVEIVALQTVPESEYLEL